MNNDTTFVLTDDENRQARATTEQLTQVEPRLVDAPDWLHACRGSSAELPSRLRRRLAEFRNDPGDHGSLLVRNLPVVVDRPTPADPGSVERDATTGAALIGMVSMQLGDLIAYRNEKSGALVQNVVPVPGQEAQQSNAGSTRLEMHIENAFHPHRPDYVGLLCVRSDHERVAGLQIACVRRAVDTLPGDVRTVLGEPRFVTDAPPSFGGGSAAAPRHAVLTGHPDDPDIRVDFHATHGCDVPAKDALEILRDALTAVTETLVLEPGDLALVDNRVALHGRTLFTPRYDGEDRWLYRTFVHLDHRRSRAFRSRDGHVLD
ncbi:TauD/TfdA family dioxygenase [Saccharomonospora cyanea]|uniref:Putative taurine catabolism dioxygenase n=1 Tax=Saccharomonospora cyanea NA-134 TaxID=882082 RepID=H5XI24_9PSEU|nr:TauD/TfdA family dioxygenase [Saccharomonospora cyanea]EHR60654.1 putative taurine catabolism dioxygenase [Saccharomonospora cyanea NA-134]